MVQHRVPHLRSRDRSEVVHHGGFQIGAILGGTDAGCTLRVVRRFEAEASIAGSRTRPRREASLALPAGPAAIRAIELRLENTNAQALRTTVLRAEFDGEETIWCPVGDYFGSGVGLNVLESWQRTVTKEGALTCRWVMPYKESARLRLLNLSKEKIAVKLDATVDSWKWDDRSMHFHANWRQQYPLPTRPMSDWNYITVTGRGVYVGDTLSVLNPVADWWGEGDEKVWIDGEAFPSYFGTGTEDHYGYAWGDQHLFQTPFANQIRCDGPANLGHIGVTRTAQPRRDSVHQIPPV